MNPSGTEDCCNGIDDDCDGDIDSADSDCIGVSCPVRVDIYVHLQGDNLPFPAGWQIPIQVGFFSANSGTVVMSGSSAALYWFEGTTFGTITESGTRAHFQCPTLINPGNYDITADSSTTLLNVKRDVRIW